MEELSPQKESSLRSLFKSLWPFALDNLKRNRNRSLLTVLGIFVGIAATLFLGTMGSFIQKKVLESYRDLGSSAFRFHAYPNWRVGKSNYLPFFQLNYKRDIVPLRRLFPEIDLLSPLYKNWRAGTLVYGGRQIGDGVDVFGISTDFFKISDWKTSQGRLFTRYDEKNASQVCLIGQQSYKDLFRGESAIGAILEVHLEDKTSVCRVVGVLAEQKTGSQWEDPNKGLFVPHTVFSSFNTGPQMYFNFLARVQEEHDVTVVGPAVEKFFQRKYGSSGEFRADKNSLLLAQMQKFTFLMRVLLAAISFICLLIGGVGLMNMMLVSVSERLSELGLLKALGASGKSLKQGVLLESFVLCTCAGVLGVIGGYGFFQTGLWILSRFVQKLEFEWFFDWTSLFVSVVCILIVALLSASVPARRAERLDVVEAMKGRA